MSRRLWTDLTLATMVPGGARYGLVENGALAAAGGRIVFAGAAVDLPAEWRDVAPETLGGRLVTPALVDCHTHIVFGGNRAREFAMRLEGATYEEIARAGGGILSSVTATRAASEDELAESARPRLRTLLATATGPQLAQGLDALVGSAWDDELEPYRTAGEGAPVTWLHQVV